MTKTALITGASRGLGAAMALALAPTHHIVAVAKTTGALEELDDRIKAAGGAATLAPMDIGNDAAMQTLCRGIYDRWGSLDMWAHCAVHAAPLAPANMIGTKDMTKSIAGNVAATATLITYIAPLLGTDGQALFLDDPVSGDAFYGAYGATTAAQIALARSWQAAPAKTGPKVHIATPRPMPTATRARFHPGEDRSALSDPAVEAARILSELSS